MSREEFQKQLETFFVQKYAEGYRTGHILEIMSEKFERSVDTLYRRMNISELKNAAKEMNV